MKSLIALPVLALLTLACGGEESMRTNRQSNSLDNARMQSIIDDHSPSLTEKQKSVIETEIEKFVSKMKDHDEVPESCYNAIQSPLKALYTSTMAKDDKSIKLAKEEVNKVTNDVELCGQIAEYNQASMQGGLDGYPAGGSFNGYPQGGGEVVVGEEIVGGGVLGPDLLGIGYWFGTNITNSIITIVEASKYCDTAGIFLEVAP